jgi:DNA-binding NarL/FixJ family response regulator
MTINVLIVHDNPLFRAGLRSVLERQEGMHIVGEAVQLYALLDLVADTKPVVLFDGGLTSCQPAYCATEVVDLVRKTGVCGIMVFAPCYDEETLFVLC